MTNHSWIEFTKYCILGVHFSLTALYYASFLAQKLLLAQGAIIFAFQKTS